MLEKDDFIQQANHDIPSVDREQLRDLRTAAVRRREDFQRHREEILDLAAFYGELLNDEEETPGLWGWREVEPGHPEYVVGPRRYNPLRRAMLAWNFGPEVAAYSLQGYHLKVECRDA